MFMLTFRNMQTNPAPEKPRKTTTPTLKLRLKRIPLKPRPIENPDDAQLVIWALRENILQRLSPKEADLPPDRISVTTMIRLKALYSASVQRWKLREQKEQALIRHSGLISKEVAKYFEKKPVNQNLA